MLKQKVLQVKQKITHQHKIKIHFKTKFCSEFSKRSKYYVEFASILKSKITISSIILLLVIIIPNAYSENFDEEACLSLVSAEQVQDISGYDKTLNARIINANLESLNEGMISGCVVTFEREGLDFGLTIMATASNDERIAQSNYGEVFSASHQSGKEVTEGNNGPWIHHLIVFNEKGIDSIAASIKNNIQVGVNAPTTDFSIEPSAIVEILKIVQSNVDKLDIPKEAIADITLDSDKSEIPQMEKQLSPKKQISQGIEPTEVQCNEGLVLIFKQTGSPACVKSDTASKLVERNWA